MMRHLAGRITRAYLPLALVLFMAGMALLLSGAHHAGAGSTAAGELDRSFAGFHQDGDINFYYDEMMLLDVVPYRDQGWVVLGWVPNELMVRRFTYDGGGDESFGREGTGTVYIPLNLYQPCPPTIDGSHFACGLAVDEEGRIVIAAAEKGSEGRDYLVIRLRANGEMDTSFGTNGLRTINFDGGDDQAYDVALQKDGKIVIAGTATDVDTAGFDDTEFGTARLTSDGDLDPSFSGDGRATATFDESHLINPNEHLGAAVAIQDDGKIVVVGTADNSGWCSSCVDYDFGVVRYNTDGTLDKSFSGDGKVNTGFGGRLDGARAVSIQSDGKIVVAGQVGDRTDIGLVRYQPDGALDKTFGEEGKVRMEMSDYNEYAVALAVQPDGKLVLAGRQSGQTFIARYWPDGALDTSFGKEGADGIQFLLDQSGRAMALQPDGKFILGSESYLSRFRADLSLDEAGINTTNFGFGDDRGQAVLPLRDGGYLIAGDVHSPLAGNGTDVALMRYGADGQLDRSFGLNGRSAFELINDDAARAVAHLPNGKVLVGGYRDQGADLDFALWRFHADGSVDTSFGSHGFTTLDFDLGDDYGQDLVVQDNGKIILAGFSLSDDGRHLTMARFEADGDLDLSFAEQGKFVEDRGPGYFSLRALAELPGGDLLATGGQDGDFWAYRFTAGGVPVNGFGNGGYQEYELIGNDEARAIGILPSGVIVLGGYSGGDFALLFILDDGSMCLGPCDFLGESRLKVDFGEDEGLTDLAVQSNGKIILAGAVRDTSTSPSGFLVARIGRKSFPSPGYGLDSSFGTDGTLALRFAQGAVPYDVALYGEHILLAGASGNGGNTDVALARLMNDHREDLPVSESVFFLPVVLE